MGKRLAILLAMLLMLPGVVPVAAQAESTGLMVKAEAGLGGHFKFGEWLPVWVELENAGAERTVEVQVRVVGTWGGTTFAKAVSLPTGSRKRVPVYVLPNNYSRALEVGVVEGSELLQKRAVDVRSHLNTDYLVGIVAFERGALTLVSNAELKGVERKVVLIDLMLEHLPDRTEGLQSLDCLVMNDVDTSTLTPEQRVALQKAGGLFSAAGQVRRGWRLACLRVSSPSGRSALSRWMVCLGWSDMSRGSRSVYLVHSWLLKVRCREAGRWRRKMVRCYCRSRAWEAATCMRAHSISPPLHSTPGREQSPSGAT
jgi:hypothetical protein